VVPTVRLPILEPPVIEKTDYVLDKPVVPMVKLPNLEPLVKEKTNTTLVYDDRPKRKQPKMMTEAQLSDIYQLNYKEYLRAADLRAFNQALDLKDDVRIWKYFEGHKKDPDFRDLFQQKFKHTGGTAPIILPIGVGPQVATPNLLQPGYRPYINYSHPS